MASSLFNLRAWHYFCTISPSFLCCTSWPGTLHFIIHTFFTQSLSSFHNTCLYHHSLFCYNTENISSIPSLSVNPLHQSLSCSLMSLICLTIFISARWSATSFSFLTGQVSLPCNILLCMQLLYNLSVTVTGVSLLVSDGTNCPNVFHPIQILHSSCHLNNKTYPLTPDLYWTNVSTCASCTGY